MKKFVEKYGIKFCTNHTAKMEGMASLSTSPLCNARCIARSQCKGLICSKCYSLSMQLQYTNLAKVLKANSEVLTKVVIPVEEWPILNYAIFRIESFGDVSTTRQVRNYFNLALRNPRTTFTAWTKNVDLYRKAIKNGAVKPKNFILIESSPIIDEERKIREGDIVDKVFTVYSKEYLAAHPEVKINCGARNCLKCQKCYRKGGATQIREILK